MQRIIAITTPHEPGHHDRSGYLHDPALRGKRLTNLAPESNGPPDHGNMGEVKHPTTARTLTPNVGLMAVFALGPAPSCAPS
jgi:hypothetical protein